MLVDGVPHRSIEFRQQDQSVHIIDQTLLPHELRWVELHSLADAAIAIADMQVRGAPLIGVTAAAGLFLGAKQDSSDDAITNDAAKLQATRPTAINLRWAIERVTTAVLKIQPPSRVDWLWQTACSMADEDVTANKSMAEFGLPLIESIARKKQSSATSDTVNILTHCNAGWLATVDWGTATAPIYLAHQHGIKLHVWVDETRPRNQGASLTAWELGKAGVPHTLIVDNAGGHLMQSGQVDLCIVGTDRVATNGDVCNKIGTYLKALAAFDNQIPFYVAAPDSSIDWTLAVGVGQVPIEYRSDAEITVMRGRLKSGGMGEVEIAPMGVKTCNPAFDVTPARLITKLITPRGVCAANREGLLALFGDRLS